MRPSIGMEEYRDRIRSSIEWVEDDLARPFDLDVLARRSCMAPFHFHNVFRKTIGCAPVEYLRVRRLSLAAQDLLLSDSSIGSITDRCGYASPEALSRAFHKHFHVWPSQYRSARRELFLQNSELTIPQGMVERTGVVQMDPSIAPRRVFGGLFLRGKNSHCENMRLLYRFLEGVPAAGGDHWINADREIPGPEGMVYEFFVGREVEGEWAVGEGCIPLVLEPRQEVSFLLNASLDDLHGPDSSQAMDRSMAALGWERAPGEWKWERRWGPDRWTRRVYQIGIGVRAVQV
ncbi:MAG: helix-turn-helix transcriptional regulator [Fibrobacterota bacterium]|nr:helix-turn-helix transcriptional regulator [Fibrobacterota bacterium]QQS06245.1 MAG: helix-turn-helix transcriptional regulator [Fibrobacterota bacterium]